MKQYEAPRLTTHGDIRALTQGTYQVWGPEIIFQKKDDPTS